MVGGMRAHTLFDTQPYNLEVFETASETVKALFKYGK